VVSLHEQFVTDAEGKRLAVILPIADYEALLEEFEDRYAVKRYDEAKEDTDEPLPLEAAVEEMERNRAGR
jgi:hypothetical protein